jgi:hypothetical protein
MDAISPLGQQRLPAAVRAATEARRRFCDTLLCISTSLTLSFEKSRMGTLHSLGSSLSNIRLPGIWAEWCYLFCDRIMTTTVESTGFRANQHLAGNSKYMALCRTCLEMACLKPITGSNITYRQPSSQNPSLCISSDGLARRPASCHCHRDHADADVALR